MVEWMPIAVAIVGVFGSLGGALGYGFKCLVDVLAVQLSHSNEQLSDSILKHMEDSKNDSDTLKSWRDNWEACCRCYKEHSKHV